MEATQTTKETLHLYMDDDGNAYAARDLAHAQALWVKDTGQPIEDAGSWASIPDHVTFTVDDDDAGKETNTAYEWANLRPSPGFRFGRD